MNVNDPRRWSDKPPSAPAAFGALAMCPNVKVAESATACTSFGSRYCHHSNWMGTMRERHLEGRRRAQMNRRSGKERRWGERRSSIPNPTAAYEGKECRKGERRSGKERREAVPPATDGQSR